MNSRPFRGLGAPLYLASTSKVLFLVCAKISWLLNTETISLTYAKMQLVGGVAK